MLKNVTLVKATKDGKATWLLLGPNGLPLESFTAFADSLLRKHGFNTRNSYCRHLAIFYDYLGGFKSEVQHLQACKVRRCKTRPDSTSSFSLKNA